jgi:hypothetical protein
MRAREPASPRSPICSSNRRVRDLAAVHAQVITGDVKDASGAVLPGVTVEVSSPALIDKVRAVVTDGVGQSRVVNLLPGTYAATFTLTRFSAVRPDGIEVTGDGAFTSNAEMRVGAVAETVTVTGETPVVDTESVRRQVVLSSDVVAEIPPSDSLESLQQILNQVVSTVLTRPGSRCSIQHTHRPHVSSSPMCSFLRCLAPSFPCQGRVRFLISVTTERRECDDWRECDN